MNAVRTVLLGAVFSAVVVVAPVRGAEQASRLVDRTLLCKMTGVGYPDPARILRVGSATYNPGTSDLPASISVSQGASGSGASVSVVTGINDQPHQSYAYNTRTTCSASKLRVPLIRRLLTGGSVQFSTSYDCDVPARVLIRVKAIFERPPRVLPDGSARGTLVDGYIAVTTSPDRRPIAFASMNGASQQTKVFVSGSFCQKDS